MLADDVLAEALCRIEFKLDLLLAQSGLGAVFPKMDNFSCPTCKLKPEYSIDLHKQVVVRKCGCGTGKIPSSIPLFPNPLTEDIAKAVQGKKNGSNEG